MGVATGNDDDGCAVVVSKILICRMRRAASYPANTRSFVGPVSVGATGLTELLTTPGGALRTVFQHDAHLVETVTRGVGRRPVFRLTGVQTLLD